MAKLNPVPAGKVQLLPDVANAALIREEGTETQEAVDSRISAVAALIIAADPTLAQAAAEQLAEQILAQDLVKGDDPRLPYSGDSEIFAGYGVVFLGEGMRALRWLATTPDGEPHEIALQSLGDAQGIRFVSMDPRYGYILLALDSSNRIIWGVTTEGRVVPEVVRVGPTAPTPWPGQEAVWFKTDGAGTLLDIQIGVG